MQDMMKKLDGYKTYIVGLMIVVSAFSAFLHGDLTLLDAIQRALEGLGLASLRYGIKSELTKP